ncbi:MAG: NUDIX hydrolase N-terminal domain-containing protein [Austwickia sp.]|nr:MAG: NUDIX hydrolase N-terminal domain-containing protein [Austwickia sp.]
MELTAHSQSGLAFCGNDFDAQRLHRIGALAGELMGLVAAGPLPPYEPRVAATAGYATPKVDVRGAVFDEAGRVLLVQELHDDGRWTLPGGWCDVLDTPTGAIEREVFEEAGLRVRARHLAAVCDREAWGHEPPFDVHVFKLFFVCDALEPLSDAYTSIETGGVGWFAVDDLPELSRSRIVPEQIRLLHRHWRDPGPAHVD